MLLENLVASVDRKDICHAICLHQDFVI